MLEFSVVVLSSTDKMCEIILPDFVKGWEDFVNTKRCSTFLSTLPPDSYISADVRHYVYPAKWAGAQEYFTYPDLRKRLLRDYRFLAEKCEQLNSIELDQAHLGN